MKPLSLLRVTLTLRGPWAVGSVNDWRTDAHLPVLADLRNGGRAAHLPATSLVGSLREHMRVNGVDHEQWLGPGPQEDGDVRVRSPLRILGVRLTRPGAVEVSHHTAVDGSRRAAVEKSLRVSERVEACESGDTIAVLYAIIERDIPDSLPSLLWTWAPFVGRGRSVGLGASAVTNVEVAVIDLASEVGLRWWLGRRDEWYAGGDAGLTIRRPDSGPMKGAPAVAATPAVMNFAFTLQERLAVGSGAQEQRQPASTRAPEPRPVRHVGETPIVPGSAWKGIFRHRCEHILRAVDHPDAESLVANLFGSAHSTEQGHRGVLRFNDGAVRTATGDPAPIKTRKHVAIDRFTGGAMNGAHFAVKAVDVGAHVSCTIESAVPWPRGVPHLLCWVARDLHDGLIGVGGLTSRGYGTVRLTDSKVVDALGPIDSAALTEAAVELHHALHGGIDG